MRWLFHQTFLCGILYTVAQTSDRSGWLFFKKYTDGDSTPDQWIDPSYSDTSDMDKFAWGLKYMIDLTSMFRSPLLEEWDDAGFKELSFVLFNNDGEEMRRYDFNVENTNAELYTFYDYLAGVPNSIIHIDTHYSLPFTIASKSSEDKFVFSILNVTDTNHGNQEYFILTTNHTRFSNLTEAVYEDCFKATANSIEKWVVVEDVYQCTYHCLAASDYDFIELFSEDTSHEIFTYCRCIEMLPGIYSSNCDYECDPSRRPCGELIQAINPQTIIATSVYKISSSRQAVLDIADMTNVSNWVDNTFIPNVDTLHSMNLGETRYIRRLFLESNQPAVNFTMATTTNDCGTTGFLTSLYKYYGQAVGDVKVFESDTIIDFSPFPARCLLINVTYGALTATYKIKVKYIQGNFVKADYLGIYGTWANKECSVTDGMAMPTIIHASQINVGYTNTHTLAEMSGPFLFPRSSVGYLHVKLPSTSIGDDYWIKYVNISTSDDVIVRGTANASRFCTNQLTGQQTLVEYDISNDITVPTNGAILQFAYARSYHGTADRFCAERMFFEIQTDTYDISQVNEEIGVTIAIYGCLLKAGSTEAANCQDLNLLSVAAIGLSSNITTNIRYIPDRAYPAIRPGSTTALSVSASRNAQITIDLSDRYETEVERVVVKGDGNTQGAHFEFGSDHEYVSTSTGLHDLNFIPNSGQGHEIKINTFTGNSITPFAIRIQVSMCTNHLGYFLLQKGIQNNAPTTQVITSTTAGEASTTAGQATTTAGQATTTAGQATTTAGQATTTAGQATSTAGQATTTTGQATTTAGQATTTAGQATTTAGQATKTAGQATSTAEQATTTAGQATTTSGQTTTTAGQVTTTAVQATTTTGQVTTTAGQATTTAGQASTTTEQATKTTGQVTTTAGQATTTVGQVTTAGLNNCTCVPMKVYTQQELDEINEQHKKNLTIPRKSTSAYRRLKTSASDSRPSATYLGTTCGVVVMTFSGALVFVFDIEFIRGAFNMALGLFRSI